MLVQNQLHQKVLQLLFWLKPNLIEYVLHVHMLYEDDEVHVHFLTDPLEKALDVVRSPCPVLRITRPDFCQENRGLRRIFFLLTLHGNHGVGKRRHSFRGRNLRRRRLRFFKGRGFRRNEGGECRSAQAKRENGNRDPRGTAFHHHTC